LPLNTRCIEFHEVGEGGQLVADDTGEQHYDSGRYCLYFLASPISSKSHVFIWVQLCYD
jgi:hypothetical protein